MTTQNSEMVAKAKEMREVLALQLEKSANTKQKVENLVGALKTAKTKLIPTNLKAAQIQQLTGMTNDTKTKIAPPPFVKTRPRLHRQINF